MIEVNKSQTQIPIIKYSGNETHEVDDILAIEEPLEIRILHGANQTEKKLSVTMRTPIHDHELAVGFLFTEGIIAAPTDVVQVRSSPIDENIVTVELRSGINLEMNSLERNFYTTSSCGVCGKSSIDAVKTKCQIKKNPDRNIRINPETIYILPKTLREKQEVFKNTGGLHASALYHLNGEFITLREDVGRHNALDKLIGYALTNQLMPMDQYILLLSGRASFELIQKSMMAGIQLIAAIGAPSSLAVQLAKESNITLIGFLKENKMNVYTGKQRIGENNI